MTVLSWEHVVPTGQMWKRDRLFHSHGNQIDGRLLQGIKLAVLGIPSPPVTNMVGTRLVCCCLRSEAYNSGCRICWAVNIGNKSLSLRIISSGSSDDMVTLVEAAAEQCVVLIGRESSLIRVKYLSNDYSRLLDILGSFRKVEALPEWIQTYDIERLTLSEMSNKTLDAISSMIWGRVAPMFRHVRTGCRESVKEKDLNQLHPELADCLRELGEYKQFLSVNNPEALAKWQLSLSSDTILDNYRDVPGSLSVSSIYVEANMMAKSIGKLTVAPKYMSFLEWVHDRLLIHSVEVAWQICSEVLDSFLSGAKTRDLCSVFGSNFPIQVVEGSIKSTNVFDFIECVSFTVNGKTQSQFPLKDLEIYAEMFKLLVSIEFAVYSLSKSWKQVHSWTDAKQLHALCWNFHSHAASIRSYLRLLGVEANQRKLAIKMHQAQSWFEQLEEYSRFMQSVRRDLFLLDSAYPFKQHINLLSQSAVDFRLVIERCQRFQLPAKNVLEQLDKVRMKFETCEKFFRKNLKAYVWTFI